MTEAALSSLYFCKFGNFCEGFFGLLMPSGHLLGEG